MGLSDELSKYIPKDFGKKKKSKSTPKDKQSKNNPSTDKVSESNDRKVAISAAAQLKEESKDTASNTIEKDLKSNAKGTDDFPINRHIQLKPQNKAVSALAWDPTGDVLVTGDHGSTMNIWDFTSMDSTFAPTRTITPYESQQIHDIKFNNDGTHFLCVTGDPRAKLYDIDGRQVREFKRGDMYVIDMRKTNGHVASMTACDWSPRDNNEFATSSADSTVRVWDAEMPLKQKYVMVAKTKQRGVRVAVTAIAYSHDAKTIASAQNDGCISVWSASGSRTTRPVAHLEGAHEGNSEISSVAFAPDRTTLATRGSSSIKLWDIRNLKHSLAVRDLPSSGVECNLAFSPDGRHILTGAECASPAEPGRIAVLNSSTLKIDNWLSANVRGSVIRVVWHPRINQIATTAGSGEMSVLYSPTTSVNGAALCANRRPRRSGYARESVVSSSVGTVITPHALPLFREETPMSTKRRRDKARADPRISHKPEEPVIGHGKGGEIGVNETQYIMRTLMKDTMRDEDPREALLKYAELAESDPMFVTPAYKGTQDKPIFDETADLDDEPKLKRRK